MVYTHKSKSTLPLTHVMLHGDSLLGLGSEDQTIRIFNRPNEVDDHEENVPLLRFEKMMVGHLDEIVDLKSAGIFFF